MRTVVGHVGVLLFFGFLGQFCHGFGQKRLVPPLANAICCVIAARAGSRLNVGRNTGWERRSEQTGQARQRREATSASNSWQAAVAKGVG